MTTLGERLKSLREQKKKSISDMATLLGVAATTYREWELGRAIKGETAYVKMSLAFGTSLEYLMTGKQNSTDGIIRKLEEIEKITREIRECIANRSI